MSGVRALTGAVMLGVAPAAGGGAFIIGTSQIGTGTLSTGQWDMLDHSDRCLAITTSRGRSKPYGPLRAGTATVELNDADGLLAWSTSITPGHFRVGSPIVIGGRPNNTGAHDPVFTGKVDTITHSRNMANSRQTIVLTCTEVQRELTQDNELAAGLGAGELTGARLNRLLDTLESPPLESQRDIDAGTVTMSQTFTTADPTPLLDAVNDVQFVEGGAFFTDRLGRYAFRQRITGSTPVVLTAGDTAAFAYRVPNMAFELSDEYVVNDITLGRAGSSSLRSADETSVTTIGRRAGFTRLDLPMADNTQVQGLIDHYLESWARVKFVRSIELTAVRAPWASVLTTLELFDVVEFNRTFKDGISLAGNVLATPVERERTIDGPIDSIGHRWRAGEAWTTTLAISTNQF